MSTIDHGHYRQQTDTVRAVSTDAYLFHASSGTENTCSTLIRSRDRSRSCFIACMNSGYFSAASAGGMSRHPATMCTTCRPRISPKPLPTHQPEQPKARLACLPAPSDPRLAESSRIVGKIPFSSGLLQKTVRPTCPQVRILRPASLSCSFILSAPRSFLRASAGHLVL